ncbi:transglutaminase domain-containing protein [Persephonella sp.]
MIGYKITYHTENSYSQTVKEAIFDFLVLPADDDRQRRLSHKISSTLKEPVFMYKNLYGFDVLRIRTSKAFDHFEFTVHSTVHIKKEEERDMRPLSIKEEVDILTSDSFRIDNFLFLRKTRYTLVSPKNKKKFIRYDGKKHVFDFLLELNNHIYNLIEYCTLSTDVHTIADQVFEMEKGVCQDYSHAFIAVARENGIPARYVSGYLNQGVGFIGDTLMHAWVEALVPGVGWVGFDPTNNQLAGENHIKVAHGEDYSDCAPIKGVLKTTGTVETKYSVQVIQEQQ